VVPFEDEEELAEDEREIMDSSEFSSSHDSEDVVFDTDTEVKGITKLQHFEFCDKKGNVSVQTSCDGTSRTLRF